VNFTTSFGDQVSFDENGDALPIYDVMNWLWLPDGRIEVQNVGEVKRSAYRGEELILDEDKIFWNFESKRVNNFFFMKLLIWNIDVNIYKYEMTDLVLLMQPPRSVCSDSCPPGTRMARKKGQPECCFDCIPCSEGKTSNQIGPCFSIYYQCGHVYIQLENK